MHEEAVSAVAGLKRQRAMGQFDLFGADEPEPTASPVAHLRLDGDEWPQKELLSYEREMLGLYVSAHPLDGADHVLAKAAPRSIGAVLANPPREGELVIAGMISGLERRVNKKGEPWAIAVIEDLDAAIEVLFFPKVYAVLHGDLVEDAVVVVKGRVNWREDRMSVFGSDLAPLDVSQTGEAPLVLEMDAEPVAEERVSELRSTLRAHRGSTPVRIVVCHLDRRTWLAVDDYPVALSPALLGELRGIPGVRVVS